MAAATRCVMIGSTLLITACRDGVPLYEAAHHDFEEQLTFSAGQDLRPRWTSTGDDILYYADDYGPLPCVRGVALRIPSEGGVALPVFGDVQRAAGRIFMMPTQSPDGSRIAYFDVIGPIPDCGNPQPVSAVILRVRAVDGTTPPLQDPSLAVNALAGLSWSPDNERIVFGDNSGLRIWRVGEPHAASVPGTAGASSPAWSPDGDRIAFALGAGATSSLVLVRPDGTDHVLLGTGADPAWSPDARFLYAHRDNRIVRIALEGGAVQPIANTMYGRQPAVSPDGRWLAFSRPKLQGAIDYDIWVIAL